MSNKVMRYVRDENQDLQLYVCEYGVWKHYRRVLYSQQDTDISTPGFRTAQYYMKLGYEMLPTISVDSFNGLIRLKANMK